MQESPSSEKETIETHSHLGKIMKLGNTFVRIGSPKFLTTIFRPNSFFFLPKDRLFQPKHYSAEILHVKSNDTLMVPSIVMYTIFWMIIFPAVSIFRLKGLFLTESIKNKPFSQKVPRMKYAYYRKKYHPKTIIIEQYTSTYASNNLI